MWLSFAAVITVQTRFLSPYIPFTVNKSELSMCSECSDSSCPELSSEWISSGPLLDEATFLGHFAAGFAGFDIMVSSAGHHKVFKFCANTFRLVNYLLGVWESIWHVIWLSTNPGCI